MQSVYQQWTWAARLRRLGWAGVILAVTAALVACSSPASPAVDIEATERQVNRIGVEQAKLMVDQGRATLVDTRSEAEHRERRAAGAIAAPLGDIARNPVMQC